MNQVIWRLASIFALSLITSFTFASPSDIPSASPHQQTSSTSAKHTAQQRDNHAFDQGNMTFATYGDSELGFISELGVSSYIASKRQATTLSIAGGPRSLRTDLTYAMALSDHQRAKVSGEYLQEKRDFSFATSHDKEWARQNAVGGSYAYLLDNPYIKSLQVGGYYAKSFSDNLSDLNTETAQNTTVETRRIAGANSGNMYAQVSAQLWPQSRLTAGMDYDIVHFDTRFAKQNEHGLGGHAQLEQRLLPQLKASVVTRIQKVEHEVAANVGWIAPTRLPTEIVAKVSYTDSHVTHRHFYTSGLQLNVSLERQHQTPMQRHYSGFEYGQQQSLLDWSKQSDARLSQVITVSDSHSDTTLKVNKKRGDDGPGLHKGNEFSRLPATPGDGDESEGRQRLSRPEPSKPNSVGAALPHIQQLAGKLQQVSSKLANNTAYSVPVLPIISPSKLGYSSPNLLSVAHSGLPVMLTPKLSHPSPSLLSVAHSALPVMSPSKLSQPSPILLSVAHSGLPVMLTPKLSHPSPSLLSVAHSALPVMSPSKLSQPSPILLSVAHSGLPVMLTPKLSQPSSILLSVAHSGLPVMSPSKLSQPSPTLLSVAHSPMLFGKGVSKPDSPSVSSLNVVPSPMLFGKGVSKPDSPSVSFLSVEPSPILFGKGVSKPDSPSVSFLSVEPSPMLFDKGVSKSDSLVFEHVSQPDSMYDSFI